MRTLGVLLLLTVAGYLLFCGTRPTLRLFGWDLPLPSRPLLAGQFATGVLDWAAQALIFWFLLPDAPGLTLPVFGACFFAAMLLSMIGHVPAGLGVLDTGILVLLGRYVPEAELVGVLILFRLIYHVAPLALALLLLAGFEVAQRRGRGRRPPEPASKAEA